MSIKIPKSVKQGAATIGISLFGFMALNTLARRFRPAAKVRDLVGRGI